MRISLEKPYASVAQFRNQSILFAVASLPLMLVVFLFIRRFVTRPLQAMAGGLAELAKGEGDLTRRLEVKHQDEIGKTAGLFNQMLGPLPIWSGRSAPPRAVLLRLPANCARARKNWPMDRARKTPVAGCRAGGRTAGRAYRRYRPSMPNRYWCSRTKACNARNRDGRTWPSCNRK
jgi:HAMP domain-containing protein